MKTAIISVVGLLSLAIGAQAQNNCGAPTYTENVVPNCNKGVQLPNYANVSTFYKCVTPTTGTGTPIPTLMSCDAKTPVFTYVYQGCTACSNYIPAVPCSRLQVDVACEPIKGGVTQAPTTVTTPKPTVTTTPKPTTTPKSTATTGAPTPPGPAVDSTTTPSPVGPGGTTVYIPMPPSPNEGPTPPGPDPTVPNLPSGPPVSNN